MIKKQQMYKQQPILLLFNHLKLKMNKKYNKSPNNKAKWMNNKKRPNKICNLNNLR